MHYKNYSAFLFAVSLLLGLSSSARALDKGDSIVWQDVALLDGRVLKADALNRQTVIVGFWATWCPFCARQNPHVNTLHNRAGGKYLVLMFSVDKTPVEVTAYLKDKGYSFAVAMSPQRDSVMFGRRKALPETYVIAPGGKVLFKELGEMFPEDVLDLGKLAQ